MDIEVSIIVVNYNTTKLINDLVSSIKKAKIKLPYETIVVDNGSTEKLQPNDDYILISNNENLGFGKGNNLGMKVARGKYWLLLNSDIILKPGVVENLVEFAKTNQKVGIVGPKLLNKDGSLQPSCFHFPTIINAFRQYWFGEKNLFEKYAPAGKFATKVDVVAGAAWLITPEAIKKVGMFDPRYFMYFEDLDYCRRVKREGLSVYYLPEVSVYHLHGASGASSAMLVDSSKIYHGWLKHYILTLVLYLGQKIQKCLNLLKTKSG